jgi:hypothetical protein
MDDFIIVRGSRGFERITKGGVVMSLAKRSIAELVGTFWLVFGGCGSAVLRSAF